MTRKSPGVLWALLATSLPMFMVSLDNLVVTNALADIAKDLHTKQSQLEWVVNGYMLSFAGLLLAGAALGDRFGRLRVFTWGIVLFTASSAACALSDSVAVLVTARVFQGAGAAMILPVSLTLAVNAVTAKQRNMAVGVWGGVNGLGIAVGPLAGGLVTQGLDWHWIFWINVPIGLVLAPLAARRLEESYGPKAPLDLPGLGLVSTGLFGLVYGLVRAQTIGWTAPEVLVSLGAGLVLLAAFVRQELRSEAPMLPMSFFAKRSFAVTNVVSMAMYFGMFGSIFFLSQFMQNVLGNSALEAGLKLLVWTGATMVVAPIAGVLSERIGPRPFMVAGVALQGAALAWLAIVASTTTSYATMIPAFVAAGAGMALVFAPSASAILNSVRVDQAGQASGATNAIRELGGTFGIAVLATVFSGAGAYTSPQAFVDGMVPALWVGVAVLAAGALVAALVPFGGRATTEEVEEFEQAEAAHLVDTSQPLPAAN